MTQDTTGQHQAKVPFILAGHHLWLGIILIAVCWPLNWGLPGVRTHLLFFPLWLGYILAVDALVLRKRGTSILTRSPAGFSMLFLISIPTWWFFELINLRTANWEYLGIEALGRLEGFLLSSLMYSTVMPAVFETAELVRSFRWMERFTSGPRITRNTRTLWVLFILGVAMFALVMISPTHFYPFVWGFVYLMVEPVNAWLGRRTLLDQLQYGDWRPVVSLALGALVCGFFWELWNYYSYPKWVYHTPGVEFLHVFEMPLLGFLGYLPFALELFALLQMLKWRPLKLNL